MVLRCPVKISRKCPKHLYVGGYRSFVKVGISADPKLRCKQLALELLWVSKECSTKALDWEREVHSVLQDKRIVGEYFEVDQLYVIQLCRDAIRYFG